LAAYLYRKMFVWFYLSRENSITKKNNKEALNRPEHLPFMRKPGIDQSVSTTDVNYVDFINNLLTENFIRTAYLYMSNIYLCLDTIS
jgi:hypothetical protein